jgi:YgiT-type zinc finger domain-containing protein
MKCMHCKGNMKRKTAPFHVNRKGYHLIFDSVPAWVCTQCGEAYLGEKEVTGIQEFLKTLDEQTKKLPAAV